MTPLSRRDPGGVLAAAANGHGLGAQRDGGGSGVRAQFDLEPDQSIMHAVNFRPAPRRVNDVVSGTVSGRSHSPLRPFHDAMRARRRP